MVHTYFRSLQLKTDGKLLRDRYGALYRKIAEARHREKLSTAIHYINILLGEFNADFEENGSARLAEGSSRCGS